MNNKELAVLLKALSDPRRLSILEMLLDTEMCVCEIVDRLNISQPLVSHHLRELKIAGLVLDRRVGNWVHYRLNVDVVNVLKDTLANLFSRIADDPKKSSYSCVNATKKETVDVR